MNLRIQRFSLSLLLSILPYLAFAQEPQEPEWKPSLASGGAPECPEHTGSRTLRGETVGGGQVNAVIVGSSVRTPAKTCIKKAEILLSGVVSRTIQLPNPGKQQFSIVDFPADGRSLLLSTEIEMEYPSHYRRDVALAIVSLANGQPHWVNVWDIFGWHDCDASVELQGFTENGKVIVRARPSVWAGSKRPNCVPDIGLYETDLIGAPRRLPDSTRISRFGKLISVASQACKTDPDIVDACFTVHGRLDFWNGNPTVRIWRVGTRRILGTRDDPLPANLAKEMDWGVEAWGDFTVCPFTKERPGVMRTVCIESAENVFLKKYSRK